MPHQLRSSALVRLAFVGLVATSGVPQLDALHPIVQVEVHSFFMASLTKGLQQCL
jgi:hypothetical protein